MTNITQTEPTVTVNDALSSLTSVAQKLNRRSDELNSMIAALDARLRETAVGVSAWTDILLDEKERVTRDDDGNRVRTRRGWFLGYTKIDDAWTIAVMRSKGEVDNHCQVDEWDQDEPIALLKAPRHVRVESARYLGVLIDVIAERAQSFIEGIDEAKALAA